MARSTGRRTPRALPHAREAAAAGGMVQLASHSWWNTGFTRLLLEQIPPEAAHIVDLRCGLARAAHALMPSLPDTTYVGLETLPQLLSEAQEALSGVPFARRVSLRLAPTSEIPLPDDLSDVVLSVAALQHSPEVEALLEESVRVLRTGGRVVAVEPDNLAQRFYFNGGLEELSDVFRRLCLKARVQRQPADIAVGPRLPMLLRAAGLQHVSMQPQLVSFTTTEDAKSFFSRVRRVCQTTALHAGLSLDAPELQACDQALNRVLFAGMPKRVGYAAHTVPLFFCVGVKS